MDRNTKLLLARYFPQALTHRCNVACNHRHPEGTLPHPEVSDPYPGYPPCKSCGRTLNCKCYVALYDIPDPSNVNCGMCGEHIHMDWVNVELRRHEEFCEDYPDTDPMTAEDFRCPSCFLDDQMWLAERRGR